MTRRQIGLPWDSIRLENRISASEAKVWFTWRGVCLTLIQEDLLLRKNWFIVVVLSSLGFLAFGKTFTLSHTPADQNTWKSRLVANNLSQTHAQDFDFLLYDAQGAIVHSESYQVAPGGELVVDLIPLGGSCGEVHTPSNELRFRQGYVASQAIGITLFVPWYFPLARLCLCSFCFSFSF